MEESTRIGKYLNQRSLAVLCLGFSSGLPLVLIGSTLQARYTMAGVNLSIIGILSLIEQPYMYKFLWAPLVDRFSPLRLGYRRGWIILMQLLLCVGFIIMSFLDPRAHPWLLAWAALVVACFSSTQDISIDAYRTDILHSEERGWGAALNTFGYRIALLIGGAVALILASRIGWHITYCMMAGFVLMTMLLTMWAPEPSRMYLPLSNIKDAVIMPIKNILKHAHIVGLLTFIVIYKFADALTLSLNTTFLLRYVGLSLAELSVLYKVVGLIATVVGSLLGGWFIFRLGLFRSLMSFGFAQMVSNLSYLLLVFLDKNDAIVAMAMFVEYFCGGLSTVAFVAFLMSLCDKHYTATQYAFFSALATLGRVFAGPEAAFMVNHWGWGWFYFFSFLLGFPGLIVLAYLKERVWQEGGAKYAS